MAMVNMNNLLNGKDSRWLQLEVCREFQRNKCSRPDTECKFAHPPANVEVQNGRVTACYDSIKGRCNREKPPCKYFHPPQHLKDQLLINGRNHLALKNALMQQMGLSPGQLVPGQVPAVAANPYLTGMPQVGSTYSPYFAPGPLMPAIMGPDPTGVASPLGVVPQTVVAQQKMPRSDRLEMDMKSMGSYYYENFAFHGMMPYKRPAADKSGVPVYQPSATTYQQLMQLQQPFVPVSCEYTPSPAPAATLPATSCASPAAVSVSEPSQVPDEEPDTRAPPPAATPQPPPPNIPDPAALAKEVAQQNYAKAVKLAAVSNSLAINSLTALNYTGVSLNKQTVAMPSQAMPRYPGLPLGFNQPGLQLGLGNSLPYAAAHAAHQAQPNFLSFARPPPHIINPYSLMRPYQPSAGPQLLQSGLLTAGHHQYPVVSMPGPLPTVSVQPQTQIAQSNNNNVVLQPYKKMKTT